MFRTEAILTCTVKLLSGGHFEQYRADYRDEIRNSLNNKPDDVDDADDDADNEIEVISDANDPVRRLRPLSANVAM
jgi:hypothetical protein